MPFAGHTFKPREAAVYIGPKWSSVAERHKALATMLGESKACVGAWNDNMDGETLKSRDCGLFQISVTADRLDEFEAKLRTESTDPAEYEPVTRYNVAWARQMWETRKWQPWVAYTSGWATFPEWWVWKQVDKQPVGPWVATGRYIQKAILGWANWHLLIAKTKNPPGALASAYNQQVAWKVAGELGLRGGRVAFVSYPPKPDAPPQDGVGIRPVPNNGR